MWQNTWTRLEGRALLWVLSLHLIQVWIMKAGLPSDPDFLVLPLAGLLGVQAWLGVLPYMFPWLAVPYLLILGLLGAFGFRRLGPGRLRRWTCGTFYYLVLLLGWPLVTG